MAARKTRDRNPTANADDLDRRVVDKCLEEFAKRWGRAYVPPERPAFSDGDDAYVTKVVLPRHERIGRKIEAVRKTIKDLQRAHRSALQVFLNLRDDADAEEVNDLEWLECWLFEIHRIPTATELLSGTAAADKPRFTIELGFTGEPNGGATNRDHAIVRLIMRPRWRRQMVSAAITKSRARGALPSEVIERAAVAVRDELDPRRATRKR